MSISEEYLMKQLLFFNLDIDAMKQLTNMFKY